MIEVVSAVVFEEGRMLLTQRRPSQDFAFRWESPGGKVEGNESHHEALRRELREELGVSVSGVSQVAVFCGEFERPGKESVFVLLYRTELEVSYAACPREGQGMGWFTRDELLLLNMAPANDKARRLLIEALDFHTRRSR